MYRNPVQTTACAQRRALHSDKTGRGIFVFTFVASEDRLLIAVCILYCRSRSTDEDLEYNTENALSDEEPCSLPEVAEDNESGDSETVTEVEASEKALKFKISTEGSVNSGRKSYPGSRKGSREKAQQLNCVAVASAVQGEKDRRRLIGGTQSFDQRSLSGKKLSFDTTELLDEHTRRYFKQFCRRISHDEHGFRHAEDMELSIERLRVKRNSTAAIGILKHYDNRPCEKNDINKQNNVLAERTMEVERNSIKSDENGEKNIGDCETDSCTLENTKTVPNSCKFDKISLDGGANNKSAAQEPSENVKQEQERPEQLSPNGNRSLLSRLKQFTDRLGISIDRDSSKFRGMLSLKNNNGTRMTLPLRHRGGKKDETPPCCKSVDVDDDKRASTLPKVNKAGGAAGKKGWRQRLTLGRDRAANSLDSLPPPSPVKSSTATCDTAPVCSVASTSHSHSSSITNLPVRCESVAGKGYCDSRLAALEPDPRVLETSIELM